MRLNYATQLGTIIGASFALAVGVASSALAEVPQESSLLLNPPTQTATELPSLPPPRDPSEAAPQGDENLPSPASTQRAAQDRPFLRPVEAKMVADPARSDSAPVDATAASDALPAPIGVAPTDGPVVRQVSSIKYDTDRGARRLFDAGGGVIETVMIAQNPADGCHYEIPLCLPACCIGAPSVECDRGLLGRGVVEYCWPCGLEVKVIFRLRGDVKVEYDA